jgi:hypothetical protein
MSLKKFIKLFENNKTIEKEIQFLINQSSTNSKYPKKYNFDEKNKDEFEIQFDEFREKNLIIFKYASSLFKDYSKNFVQETLKQSFEDLKNVGFNDLELSLSLFYNLGESCAEEALYSKKGFL